ncbi:MAG: ATP synthase F1 subunit epsilon [bacterium]|nr:ATP synthase F1 subunit epsilon [bacterium]
MRLTIVTPERTVFDGEIDSVSLPTERGEITVLKDHIPLISTLTSGVITLKKNKEEILIASSGGFVQVLPESRIRVLADTAEKAEELTEEEVEKAKKKAEELVQEKRNAAEEEYVSALGSLERELARLKTIRRRKERKIL